MGNRSNRAVQIHGERDADIPAGAGIGRNSQAVGPSQIQKASGGMEPSAKKGVKLMGCAHYEWTRELKRRRAVTEQCFASSTERAQSLVAQVRGAFKADCFALLEHGDCEHYNDHCLKCPEKYLARNASPANGFCRCPPRETYRCQAPMGYPSPGPGGLCDGLGGWALSPGISKCPALLKWFPTYLRATQLSWKTARRMRDGWAADKYTRAHMPEEPEFGFAPRVECKESELALDAYRPRRSHRASRIKADLKACMKLD